MYARRDVRPWGWSLVVIPVISDTDPVAPLEDLFNTVGGAVTTDLGTLTTRVNTLDAGPGRGTRAIYTVTNLSALDALSDAVTGDLAWMTTPGTGINPFHWRAYSGSGSGIDWQPEGRIVASSKSNMDSFISAVAAISDTRFEVGGVWIDTATGITYRFTGVTGSYLVATSPTVIPTSVTGTGVSRDATTGVVTLSGSSTALIAGALPSGYRHHRVIWKLTTSGATTIRFQFASGGSAVGGTGYYRTSISQQNGTAAGSSGPGAANWQLDTDNNVLHTGHFDLYSAALAEETHGHGQSTVGPNPPTTANTVQYSHSLWHSATTAYTDFYVSQGGAQTISGTIEFEAIR